jgi:hypothetical protein
LIPAWIGDRRVGIEPEAEVLRFMAQVGFAQIPVVLRTDQTDPLRSFRIGPERAFIAGKRP